MSIAPFTNVNLLDEFEWPTTPQIWLGDGLVFAAENACWGVAAAELLGAPALAHGQTTADVCMTHRALAQQLIGSLRAWENQGALEIRYVWEGDGRIRVLLFARATGTDMQRARISANQLLTGLLPQFPAGYDFGPVEGRLRRGTLGWCEIQRLEEEREPAPYSPPDLGYYYMVYPMGGDARAWAQLPRLIAQRTTPGFVSINLIPTRLTDLERRARDHVASRVREAAEGWQDYDYFGQQVTYPGDEAAREVNLCWQSYLSPQGVLARVGVSAPADELASLASQVGALLTDSAATGPEELPRRYELVPVNDEYQAHISAQLGFVLPRYTGSVWRRPEDEAPISLERLPYFFNDSEAAGLFVLPVPDQQGVPGVALSRAADRVRQTVGDRADVGAEVVLGQALHHGQAAGFRGVPLDSLTQHALIVGSSGFGKSTTVMSLLVQLWTNHQIPFMVFESTKTEYRSLLTSAGFADLQVITIGQEHISPFRLNPLAPPAGVRCGTHRGALLATLKLALPLFSPLPQILPEAIAETYDQAGWEDDTVIEDGIRPPTLRDLKRCFDIVFNRLGFEGDVRNMGRSFTTRINSLLQDNLGKLLDTIPSTDFEALMRVPVVVEFDAIQDPEDLNVLTAFLLDRVTASARRRGNSGGKLRHVTVVEEAHFILPEAGMHEGNEASGDTGRRKSIQAFCHGISTLRARGEGFVLCSQSPATLAREAVKNTSTRVVHHLTDASDREAMLRDFAADQGNLAEVTGHLTRGEVIARWPGQEEPELVKVSVAVGVDTGQELADDVVVAHMAERRAEVAQQLPYALCTSTVCSAGCNGSIRQRSGRLAARLSPSVRDLWKTAQSPISDVVQLVANETDGRLQSTYCALSQLGADGAAFGRTDPTIDDRPLLERAVRRVCS